MSKLSSAMVAYAAGSSAAPTRRTNSARATPSATVSAPKSRKYSPKKGPSRLSSPGCRYKSRRNMQTSFLTRVSVCQSINHDFRQVHRRRRKVHVQLAQRLDHGLGDDEVTIPFVIGRDDMPGRPLGAAARQSGLVRLAII